MTDIERKLDELDSQLAKVGVSQVLESIQILQQQQQQQQHKQQQQLKEQQKQMLSQQKMFEELIAQNQPLFQQQQQRNEAISVAPAKIHVSDATHSDVNDRHVHAEESQLIKSLGAQVQLLEEEIDSKNATIMRLKKELTLVRANKSTQRDLEIEGLRSKLGKNEDELRALQVKEGEWDIMATKRANEISELMLENYKLVQNVRNLNTEKSQLSHTIDNLERKFASETSEQREQVLQNPRAGKNEVPWKDHNNTSSRKEPPPPDVIFFHDSLGKSINKTISAREGITTKKVRTAKLHQVREEIEKLSTRHAPQLFAIHVGTNDLHTDSVDEVIDKYIEIVATIGKKFPDAKILISHIVIRSDNERLQLMLDLINASLSIEFAGKDHVKVCKHLDIGVEHLKKRDGVHLTDPGTSILSKDLRYAIAKCLRVRIVP